MSNSDNHIAKILIIEDDSAIGLLVRETLEEAGYECRLETDGPDGLQLVLNGTFDLVVLDIGLPRLSGLDVCDAIKRKFPDLPVLMLTAQTAEIDVVTGLEKGADDYLTKPFGPRELLARIRVRLREKTRKAVAASHSAEQQIPDYRGTEPAILRIGELEIDHERMRVLKNGLPIELTAREFDFLFLLASNAGKPISREVLLEEVWESGIDAYSPNITIVVSRIRKKIETNPNSPKYLITVFGVGYRFAEPSELSSEPSV